MTTIKDGLVYDDSGKLIGYRADESGHAPHSVREAYMRAAQWAPVVEAFVTSPRDRAPDGRTYEGRLVRDLDPDARGHATLRAPNGQLHDVDLSEFGPDARVRVTWQTENKQSSLGFR